jgi:hypothetical protein
MGSMVLSKDKAAVVREELRPYFDALRGSEDYLRTVALQIRQEQGRPTNRKDSGARRMLSNHTADNFRSLTAVASRFERDLGVPRGVLQRLALSFHNHYQSLVRSWLVCRPDAQKWSRDYPASWHSVQRTLAKTHFQLFAFPDGLRIVPRFHDDREPSVNNAESAAARLFLELARHPLQDRLRCCRRCSEFFVAGRSDQLSCTARCATALTAKQANRRRRRKERDRDLGRLRSAVEKIASQKHLPADWKKRVARNARLTPTFVTRALTSGEIESPTQHSTRHKLSTMFGRPSSPEVAQVGSGSRRALAKSRHPMRQAAHALPRPAST